MNTFIKLALLGLIIMLLVSCSSKTTSPEESQVASPEFSPAGGIYNEATDVLISCATPGAIIRYTTNNTEPTVASPIYESPLHVSNSTTIKAKAYKSGWISSSTSAASYTFNSVLPPYFLPLGGIFNTAQTINMYCGTPDAEIRYTLNGSEPNLESALYTDPIIINSTTTLKAKAFLEGFSPSPTIASVFIMQVQTPVISPTGGSYSVSQVISITCPTPEAEIAYTLDGSDPDASSSIYTNPIQITANTLLKVKAFKSGWTPSATVSANYQINVADQMVYVPSGTFHNGFSNVSLSAYYISKYEVTQFDWVMVMGTDPSFYPENTDYPITDLPVESIDWFSAIEYCNWRSMSEGYTPCYSFSIYGTKPTDWPSDWNHFNDNHSLITCNWLADGYRLPTEMEWMYAAKGGPYSQGFLYSGSDEIDEVAWYNANSEESTMLVGTKLGNELGLFDMSGNVWEFCWDIFSPLPTSPQTDPTGPPNGVSRVIRGGSCLHDASNCTVARRFNSAPTSGNNIMGFRVARRS